MVLKIISKPILIGFILLVLILTAYFILANQQISIPVSNPRSSETLPLKLIYCNSTYIPAKCISIKETPVIEIGFSDEGYPVYNEKTARDTDDILLKRSDGQYQCYMKQPK